MVLEMNKVFPKPQLTPYEVDYAQWCVEQAALVREGKFAGLDRENLAEEIESLGRSDKREIASRMEVLIAHLLKWQFQPEARSLSWAKSIIGARQSILEILDESPSLRQYPATTVERAYRVARVDAADETGIPVAEFPQVCPFRNDDLLNVKYYPGSHQPSWLSDI